MFQTVTPRPPMTSNYQNSIIGVYSTLVGNKGKISGFGFSSESKTAQTDISMTIGVKQLVKFFSSINNAFPEYEMIIENLVIKGEKVMAKYSILGVPKGRFMGYRPNDCRLKVSGLDIFRLDQGKVMEYWNANHHAEPFH
jgi:predicted ester cyclase